MQTHILVDASGIGVRSSIFGAFHVINTLVKNSRPWKTCNLTLALSTPINLITSFHPSTPFLSRQVSNTPHSLTTDTLLTLLITLPTSYLLKRALRD